MQRIKNAFAKRKIQLNPPESKLITAAHLTKLVPETDDDGGSEKRPSLSYKFEECDYEEGKRPSVVVVTVTIEADNKSALKRYNDRILEYFGEGCRDKTRKKKRKSAGKLFRSRRDVGSTFRRVFLRGA